MAWESTRSTSKEFSACSSGCTSGMNSPVPGLGWRYAKRLSSDTAAASQWKRNPGRAPRFVLPWQCRQANSRAPQADRVMSLEVLLVEDSPGDVRLTQEAFCDSGTDVHLHVAAD